jgi:hypothetical protein
MDLKRCSVRMHNVRASVLYSGDTFEQITDIRIGLTRVGLPACLDIGKRVKSSMHLAAVSAMQHAPVCRYGCMPRCSTAALQVADPMQCLRPCLLLASALWVAGVLQLAACPWLPPASGQRMPGWLAWGNQFENQLSSTAGAIACQLQP